MRADIKAFLKTALSTKGDGPCLEWPFAKDSNGYGRIMFKYVNYSCHRVICELIYGQPPTLYHECAHSCHNSSCIRPSHLRWATKSENVSEQRSNPSDKKYKLTQSDVDAIRKDTRLQSDIAKDYSVGQPQISRIKAGKRWQ